MKKILSLEMVGLILAFAILAFAGLIAMHTEAYRRQSSAWVRHTLMVESSLHRLYGAIQRTESDERGYLLTHDEKYLSSGEDIARQIDKEFDALTLLVADQEEQLDRIARMRPLLGERLALLAKEVNMVKQGRFEEAVAEVRAGHGKTLMDQIDALIGEMLANEERLYQARDLALARATESLQLAIGLMIAVLSLVAIIAIWLLHRQMNALRDSSESLKLAYNRLMEESTRREAVEAQLRQAQKLEALGHLTGGIAHDFNNVLGVIVASLNILRRKLDRKEGDWEPLINSALEGADSAASLVRQLLAFARIQPLESRSLDANEFISDVSEMLRRTLGENIEFETVLAEGLWPTKVDPSALENALLNLAVNARDAMPNGGRLTIATGNRHLDTDYAAGGDVVPGDYVLVSVTDTGEGMAPEVVTNAFDPFFTTKPAGKGTGLGLSQVHGFIKQSGGQVEIRSELGRGTTVNLYLPREDGISEEESLGAAATGPDHTIEFPAGRPDEVILVVDNDRTGRRVLVEGMRELGYTALEASDSAGALSALDEQQDVSLMIADTIVPEIDGAALQKEALKKHPRLRILYVTGFPTSGLRNRKVDVLAKPFTLEQIARKIRSMIDAG